MRDAQTETKSQTDRHAHCLVTEPQTTVSNRKRQQPVSAVWRCLLLLLLVLLLLQTNIIWDRLTLWRVLAICCTTNSTSCSSSSYDGENIIWPSSKTSCIHSCGKLSLCDSPNRSTHVFIVRVSTSFSWTRNNTTLSQSILIGVQYGVHSCL